MAISIDTNSLLWENSGEVLNELKLSSLESGRLEGLAHKGPSGLAAESVFMDVITQPTDGSQVTMSYEGTDTTNDELDVRFRAPAGGSLSGCVVKIHAKFREAAAQDSSSITVS